MMPGGKIDMAAAILYSDFVDGDSSFDLCVSFRDVKPSILTFMLEIPYSPAAAENVLYIYFYTEVGM